MIRQINLTLIESPLAARRSSHNRIANDLVPGADPYIASLISKLGVLGGPLLSSSTGAIASDPTDMPEDLYFGEDWGCDPSEHLAW